MGYSEFSNHVFGGLKVNNTTELNQIRVNRGSIAQVTSITSGVTLNSPAGTISTISSGTLLVTNGSSSFSVLNSCVHSDSIILSNIIGFSGTGQPAARINNVTTGSFSVVLRNIDVTNVCAGDSIDIAFIVL